MSGREREWGNNNKKVEVDEQETRGHELVVVVVVVAVVVVSFVTVFMVVEIVVNFTRAKTYGALHLHY